MNVASLKRCCEMLDISHVILVWKSVTTANIKTCQFNKKPNVHSTENVLT